MNALTPTAKTCNALSERKLPDDDVLIQILAVGVNSY